MYYFLIIQVILSHAAKLTSSNTDYLTDYNNPMLRLRRDLVSTTLPPCNEDELMIYLAEIQVINPEKIISLATLEELTEICKKVSHSLAAMDSYLQTCQPPQQHDLYIELIKGVDSLYEKLCSESKFQRDFKHHYKCLHQLHTDFEDCNGPADWNEDTDKDKVCKAYHDIGDCYYIKSAELCGIKAAALMKELIIAIINSVIVVNCNNIKKNPTVADPMPEESAKKKNNLNMYYALGIILPI